MIKKELTELRKELHKHPELSGQEFETAKRIRQFIEKHHPTQIIENIGGAGLAAVYDFPEPGPVVTIRCELDALPIQEENQFAHRSANKGISHKCGHDGHMAIVAGLIFWIKEQVFNSGKIILLFQPAEENGKGAERVINDKNFQALETDYIFALHNIPQEPLGTIIIMEAGFSAEVQSFIVTLKGKASHAAEPEKGINPSTGLADLIIAISKLNNSNPHDDNFAILTPVHMTMGQKTYGISPSHAELHYTIRTWGAKQMDQLKIEILNTIKTSCANHQLAHELKWLEYFPASKNNRAGNEQVTKAAKENNFEIKERPYPFKFGEDFGWYTKEYDCAMFGLGAGMATPALHNADYDFPDEILGTGISMFARIIENILRS